MHPPRAVPRDGYLGLLRSREYVGLLLSRLVSLLGDQLSRVALMVLVFERTSSPLLSAATYALTFLPVVVAGPLLGGIADRVPRRRVLVGADLLRAGLLLLMALPGVPLVVLLLLVMLVSTVQAPWEAARAPLLREVLVDDERYQLGSALDETLDQGGQIAGFVAAGLLLTVFTTPVALVLDSLSFLVSAALVRWLLRDRPAAQEDDDPPGDLAGRTRRAIADARVGWRAAMAPACRRPLLLTWAGISVSIAPEALAAPWAASLGAGPVGVGLLFTAGPFGALVGLLLLGRLSTSLAERWLTPLAVMSVLPLALCLLDPALPVALGLVALSGAASSYSMLARVAFVRGAGSGAGGRAFSIAAAGVTVGQGLGTATAGVAAALVGPAAAVGLCGMLGLLLLALAVACCRPATGPAHGDADEEAPAAGVLLRG